MAGGSLSAEAVHQWVLPNIPGNEKYSHLESTLLNVVTSGGVSTFLLGANGGRSDMYMNAFLLGAGSNLLADAISPNVNTLFTS